ncbi:MAG: DNA/RNA non-specific endonuclease [Chitinophagaceae bacterium]
MAYNTYFIKGMPVTLPRIAKNKKKEIAHLLNGKGYIIHYLHHAIVMNKIRRFAFFTASNISGREWKNQERRGKFKKDVAIAPGHQFGNELYNAIRAKDGRPNDFEQGHLTSFQEVIWGATPAVRKQAATDTFYFTNCVPQHERVNSGLWRSLEQYILKTQTIRHDLKVTVMTGPVLSDNDPYYIKKIDGQLVKIPCVFWKVIYYANQKGLNAVGFMMSHTKLLLKDGTVSFKKSRVRGMVAPAPADDFFMSYKYDAVYQVRVEFIQEKTGLKFMLNKVHLPYQVKTEKNLLYRRIEVPPGRAMIAAQEGKAVLDYKLEGITL